MQSSNYSFFFFFNDTATTEIYTLSLHDALPISTHYPPESGGSRPGTEWTAGRDRCTQPGGHPTEAGRRPPPCARQVGHGNAELSRHPRSSSSAMTCRRVRTSYAATMVAWRTQLGRADPRASSRFAEGSGQSSPRPPDAADCGVGTRSPAWWRSYCAPSREAWQRTRGALLVPIAAGGGRGAPPAAPPATPLLTR